MNFEEALKKLEAGDKIKREGWRDSQYLSMVIEPINNVDREIIKLFLSDCVIFQLDEPTIRSDDWIVVGDETKTPIKFLKGIKLLQMNQCIQLKEWPSTTYLKLDPLKRDIYMQHYRECPYLPTFADLTAIDWVSF